MPVQKNYLKIIMPKPFLFHQRMGKARIAVS